MTEQPGWCGELLTWPSGPPSVCVLSGGHGVHESADGVTWTGPGHMPVEVAGGMSWCCGDTVPLVSAGVAA